MEQSKKYWKGLEELNNTAGFANTSKNEFAEALPVDELFSESSLTAATPRRDFLKVMGFGVGAVALASCNQAPVHKAIPYLIKPEEITPGIANYYSSTYEGNGILVKTREGRPIKIEGNPNCVIAQGGTDAIMQASVLSLYDSARLAGPSLNGTQTGWAEVDSYVKTKLEATIAKGKKVRILSSTIMSPSTKAVIAEFIAKYPNATHVTYDAVSSSAIINANKNSFDKAVLPSYSFNKAEIIVSFGADFLGTWISPVEFTKQYVTNRRVKDAKMSKHIQFETGMSLTGSNADRRVPIKPSQEGLAVLGLYNAVAKLAGAATFAVTTPEFAGNIIAETAKDLWAAKGKALVVSGSNDVSVQVLINALNSLLGSYGTTIDLDNVSYQKQGNDAEMLILQSEMARGEVGAILLYGVNPVYDYAGANDFAAALKNVDLKVSFADRADETASLCDVIAPDNHYLESWNDCEAKSGVYSLVQPTIAPVFNTRQAQQSLLVWAASTSDYYTYIQNQWSTKIFGRQSTVSNFTEFWQNAVRNGQVVIKGGAAQTYTFNKDLNQVVETISNAAKAENSKMELAIYQKIGIRSGQDANNPWLQEFPDPISKVTWDNYAAISPKQAKELGLMENDVVEIKASNYTIQLPVLLQPGQAMGTVSVALGYGRTAAGKAANNVGKNVAPFISIVNGTMQYMNPRVSVAKVEGASYELAMTQTHHSIEGRAIVRETTLGEYNENPYAGSGNEDKPHIYDLWNVHDKKGHNWAMAIDLNACTGCGSCIVACQAENNVAVVGRDEVRRRREMHWIRLDRYYSGDENTESPSVIHQPMMCQHCDHAPCETVCPVLATMHSSDGLNQQAYNRCVGTRYCANNCPYKVRRFNWFNYAENDKFDYNMNSDLGRMVLNPDVVVRSRGVMEKCSMCVQRIQAGKLASKIAGEPLADGKIQTACQQACPANAIVFGDKNDPNSEISKLLRNERTFYVLEELNVQPGVGYMTKIRNIAKEEAVKAEA